MANWLEKLTKAAPKAVPAKTGGAVVKGNTLPVQAKGNPLAVNPVTPPPTQNLPVPSVVYGVAASIFLVAALHFFLDHQWFVGFLVLLPTICFLGFALHFLRNNG